RSGTKTRGRSETPGRSGTETPKRSEASGRSGTETPGGRTETKGERTDKKNNGEPSDSGDHHCSCNRCAHQKVEDSPTEKTSHVLHKTGNVTTENPAAQSLFTKILYFTSRDKEGRWEFWLSEDEEFLKKIYVTKAETVEKEIIMPRIKESFGMPIKNGRSLFSEAATDEPFQNYIIYRIKVNDSWVYEVCLSEYTKQTNKGIVKVPGKEIGFYRKNVVGKN
ncbi:MAG: hypothetical protein LIP10_12305, partial [Clostridiales bacterium]|nr:hypothetical protein [Clostridiales bacterium]